MPGYIQFKGSVGYYLMPHTTLTFDRINNTDNASSGKLESSFGITNLLMVQQLQAHNRILSLNGGYGH